MTKNEDTRTHFVRNYVEDGTIKVKFIQSEDNGVDIFTKNTNESTNNIRVSS